MRLARHEPRADETTAVPARTFPLLIVILAVATATAGCGPAQESAAGLTRQEYLVRADAICNGCSRTRGSSGAARRSNR
jgi:hypothetical protein